MQVKEKKRETEKEQNKTTRHGVTLKFKQSQTMIAFAPVPTDGFQMLTKYPTSYLGKYNQEAQVRSDSKKMDDLLM